mmetsp:Transcript_8357/g.1120  ORF Transcript_8357/g.1120 Transcript_8357/m.1120 type:complete len:131 (-) Transcript_8357:86-478(-)
MRLVRNICMYPYQLRYHDKKRVSTTRSPIIESPEKRPFRLTPLHQTIQLVYTAKIYLQESDFTVEIYKGSQGLLIIADENDTKEHYSLGITFDEAKKVMGQLDQFDRLLQVLSVYEGDLVLLNPNHVSRR